jgi:hypothetical protein
MRALAHFLLIAVFAFHLDAAAEDTFTNPLLPSGADPWVTSVHGFYYYINTTGVNLTLWKREM